MEAKQPPAGGSPPNPNKADEGLGAILIQNQLLTPEQLETARAYARDRSCNLRHAILELNLISAERLNALAFEHLSALANGGSVSKGTDLGSIAPLQPDRAKLERDIRAELKATAEKGSAPDLLDLIVDRALDCRATDIHFDPMEGRYRLRYRIDGQLHEILDLSLSLSHAVISRIKVVSSLKLVERRHAQDGHWTIERNGRSQTLRISTLPTDLGERVVLRVHEALAMAMGFSQLGLLPEQVDLLCDLTTRPYGAILVGGPVGTGKTTTLYSSLRHVNVPTRNLMTIEDPIEYRIPGVNQVSVDPHTGLTFADGLRAILRQDPDVLMIGEIRDEETAKIGIRAALTGILVMSTIHAANAASTIATLFHYGIPGYVMAGALQGAISQRLVRRICPYCRISYEADELTLKALDLDPAEHKGRILHRGKGCNACFQTGYLGRTGVFEIMPNTDLIRELIITQTTREVLEQVARDEGMKTIKQCAIQRVLDGTTTVEELHRITI